MQKELFLRIVNALSARYEYFQLRADAAGRISLSPLQKCMVAVRQLAYGGTADMFDEYLKVGESTGRECLQNFCQGVRDTFGDTYLRKPTVAGNSCWICTGERTTSQECWAALIVCSGSGRTVQRHGEASLQLGTKARTPPSYSKPLLITSLDLACLLRLPDRITTSTCCSPRHSSISSAGV